MTKEKANSYLSSKPLPHITRAMILYLRGEIADSQTLMGAGIVGMGAGNTYALARTM